MNPVVQVLATTRVQGRGADGPLRLRLAPAIPVAEPLGTFTGDFDALPDAPAGGLPDNGQPQTRLYKAHRLEGGGEAADVEAGTGTGEPQPLPRWAEAFLIVHTAGGAEVPDDAASPEDILAAVAAQDPRVRLVPLREAHPSQAPRPYPHVFVPLLTRDEAEAAAAAAAAAAEAEVPLTRGARFRRFWRNNGAEIAGVTLMVVTAVTLGAACVFFPPLVFFIPVAVAAVGMVALASSEAARSRRRWWWE